MAHEEVADASSPIVVGVDGSPAARAALAWAISEAASIGASVLAVSVWRLPADVDGDGPGNDHIEQFVRDRLESTIASEVGAAGVAVASEVLRGRAETVLVDLSAHAALVVVGLKGQGNGDVGPRALGEVSERVLTRAHCPVVVVRAPA